MNILRFLAICLVLAITGLFLFQSEGRSQQEPDSILERLKKVEHKLQNVENQAKKFKPIKKKNNVQRSIFQVNSLLGIKDTYIWDNEINRRNKKTLYIQHRGGNTVIGQNGGNVGIGGITKEKFHVRDDRENRWATYITNANNRGKGLFILAGHNSLNSPVLLVKNIQGKKVLVCQANGRVGIGKDPSHQAQLDVNGKVRSKGHVQGSDRRWKTNLKTINTPLHKILRLRGITYHWKRKEFPKINFSQGRKLGLIAQEVEKVIPEVVHTDDKGYKSLEYSKLVPLLIEGMKTQQKQLRDKEKKIQNQGNEINSLRKKLDEQKEQLKSQRKALKNMKNKLNRVLRSLGMQKAN